MVNPIHSGPAKCDGEPVWPRILAPALGNRKSVKNFTVNNIEHFTGWYGRNFSFTARREPRPTKLLRAWPATFRHMTKAFLNMTKPVFHITNSFFHVSNSLFHIAD